MRYVSFAADGRARWGVLQGEQIVDVGGAAGVPDTLAGYLAAGSPDLTEALESSATVNLADVVLLPTIPQPNKIICVGLNYRTHILEMGNQIPSYPTLFSKFATSLVGHEQGILYPTISETVDYEAELTVVIGTEASRVTAAEALDYVAGYTILNDVSIRNFQRRTSQFMQGKTFDRSTPLGPCLVTLDEFADPLALGIKLTLNGEVMQDSSTADLIFNIPELIEYISAFMTLEPGDVIATGTPGGVGAARDPQVWMKPGDTVTVEVEGIGRLSNQIVTE